MLGKEYAAWSGQIGSRFEQVKNNDSCKSGVVTVILIVKKEIENELSGR